MIPLNIYYRIVESYWGRRPFFHIDHFDVTKSIKLDHPIGYENLRYYGDMFKSDFTFEHLYYSCDSIYLNGMSDGVVRRRINQIRKLCKIRESCDYYLL